MIETVVGLLAVSVLLALLARRLQIPYAVMLVVGGMVLAFVPGLPSVQIDPQLTLALFLPPLLAYSAFFTSWRDFRFNLRPILLLSVGLVLVTTLAVGVVVRWLIPEIPWAVAFALGAIISPPDAIAAAAILQRVKIPKRIVTVLEGESLVNDATGLVLYKLAVAATLTASFSLTEAAGTFVLTALGGIAVGLAIGALSVVILRRIHDILIELTLTLIFPFVGFLLGERLHVSGVLAVVTAGLILGWYSPEIFTARSRMQARAAWDALVFLLNSLVFILIGLQLKTILAGLAAYSTLQLLWWSVAVALTAIIVRFLWVFPAAYLPRRLSARIRAHDPMPPWQQLTIIAWTGMRGVVSLAAAMALPLTTADGAPFPGRDLVIFLSFTVIFATLVLQGPTLEFIICRLGVGATSDAEQEEHLARLKMTHAAVQALEQVPGRDAPGDPALGLLRGDYERRLEALRAGAPDGGNAAIHGDGQVRALRRAALAAERRRLIKLRREREIGDEVLHRLQNELDLEELRLG